MEVLERVAPTRIRELLAQERPFWLALAAPREEELREAGELLGLHPLAVQDSFEMGQRPKLDDYPDSALLVFYGARPATGDGGERLPRPVEVHFHLTRHAIVSIGGGELDALDEARAHIALEHVRTLEDALFHGLDAVAASFTGPLQELDDEIDEIEDVLLDDPRPDLRRQLLDRKHAVTRLRQVVEPQRDVLAGHRDMLERLPGFEDRESRNRLRDVYDRLALIDQQIETVRESLSNALDLYVSAVSNRLNEIMKVLTIVATFFLPLTFLTGFFGQNFAWMVRRIGSAAAFWGLGFGLALAIVVAMWIALTRAGYLTLHLPGRARSGGREPGRSAGS